MTASNYVIFTIRPVIRMQIEQILVEDLGIFRFIHCQSYDHCSLRRQGSKDFLRRSHHMIPDSDRMPLLHELLQWFLVPTIGQLIPVWHFYRSYWKKNPDSTLHFFSTPLFDNMKRVPFGFKKLLVAFIRVLKLVLGSNTSSFVFCYINNVLLYSSCFAGDLTHLDIGYFDLLLLFTNISVL
jgi:hypothetical protein